MTAPLLGRASAAAAAGKRLAARNPSLAIGGGLTGLLALATVLGLLWTPYDPTLIDLDNRLLPPSAAHWMGTDHLGRDILSILLAGARYSVMVAFVAVALGAGLGAPLGLLAAAQRGPIDSLVMRANDVVFAFPAVLLAILLTAWLGPGAFNAAIAIGVFNTPVFARLARAAALSLWERDFVLAARTAGKGPFRISAEHILPNIAGLLIIQATIQFALGLLAEAGLSFIGLGVAPPAPSWGRLLAEAQTLALFAPWVAIFPGLAIVLSVLGLNLAGDGLRDELDPRTRGRS